MKKRKVFLSSVVNATQIPTRLFRNSVYASHQFASISKGYYIVDV